jgi:hypothetical protein
MALPVSGKVPLYTNVLYNSGAFLVVVKIKDKQAVEKGPPASLRSIASLDLRGATPQQVRIMPGEIVGRLELSAAVERLERAALLYCHFLGVSKTWSIRASTNTSHEHTN